MILSKIFGAGTPRRACGPAPCFRPPGEFAFVLLPVALGLGLLEPAEAQLVTALAAITMLLGPIAATLLEKVLQRAFVAQPEVGLMAGANVSNCRAGFW